MAYSVWKYRLIFFGPCCNWYFPDDDDDDEDEGTHIVLGFRASRLHCSPQSCQSTAMGRDCATDSAQCCHLWLFPPELTVWPRLLCYQPRINSSLCPYQDTDKWHISVWTPRLLSDFSHWLPLLQYSRSTDSCVCVCRTSAWSFVSYRRKLRCLESVLTVLNVQQKMRLLSCAYIGKLRLILLR